MLKEFLAVSNYPTLGTDRPFQSKLILLLKIYGIIFLFNIASAPIAYLAEQLVTQVFHLKSISKHYQDSIQKIFIKYGYWKAVLYIGIIGPAIEETIFRLSLSFKKKHIAVAFGCILMLFARLIPALSQQNLIVNLLVRVVLFIAGYFAFNAFLPEIKTPNKRLQTVLIFVSILTFGLVHISNYIPLQWSVIWIYPLFVIPQLYMGWALTYIRFKNGFFWGVGLHMLINSVSMLLYTVYKHKL